MAQKLRCAVLIFLICALLDLVCADGNLELEPYKVLGLNRRAGSTEIKRAYKRLARQWHPDKNSSPEAQQKFIEIGKAYEILGNPKRKERYDRFGAVDEERSQNGGFWGHPSDGFFEFPFGGPFRTNTDSLAKNRVTLKMFEQNILSRSQKQPFMFFVYSTFCIACAQLEPLWDSLVSDLGSIGFGIGTVNAMADGGLVDKLQVTRVPSILVLVEGRTKVYSGEYSLKRVTQFSKDCMPEYLVESLSRKEEIVRFLDGWRKTNTMSVIMLGTVERPRLRYILTALRFETYARFAYVHMRRDDGHAQQLKDALGLKSMGGETLLIFNEKPAISSQERFDDLCPVSASSQKRLCAVVVGEDSGPLAAFRDFVDTEAAKALVKERVRFAFVQPHSQSHFLHPFLQAINLSPQLVEGILDALILWRTEERRAKFEYLRQIWDPRQDTNSSAEKLVGKINAYLRGNELLSQQAALNMLVDERGPSWFTRLSHRLWRLWDRVVYAVGREELVPVLSAVGTMAFILVLGYGLSWLAGHEAREQAEQRQQRQRHQRQQQQTATATAADGKESETATTQTQARRVTTSYGKLLHELRAETYFGLIRLLKPGCRSLILIVDQQTKDLLIKEFYRIIYPWRNNKTLSFGFLLVDKNLEWFRTLLGYTLPGGAESEAQNRLKNINPKQTVGTVLALNGWRMYFSIYHPMHSAKKRRAKKTKKRRNSKKTEAPNSAGHFLGFEDDEGDTADSESDSDVTDSEGRAETEAFQKKRPLRTEEVLAGLPNWLERLFEGQIHRYYVPEWPDNLR